MGCNNFKIQTDFSGDAMKVHQILPTFSPADAIGNEVILIQEILRESGYESEIFCESHHPNVSAYHYNQYSQESGKDNVLIYHHSIGSNIAGFINELPDKKMMIYHNITPASYFFGINDSLVYLLQKGRQELHDLSSSIQLAVGDSEYNRQELENAGYTDTGVLPILLDFTAYPDPCMETLERFSNGWTNVLFVGRISPNKAYEDIIKTFYYYKHINHNSRLLLPGSYEGTEIYYESLQELIRKLHLTDVYFPGKVNFEELVAYYKCADIFLCMSEHEGFNVPIVESMYFGVPIIAYNACAIPHTLGDAGILINRKDYSIIAELMHYLLDNTSLKNKLILNQEKRRNSFYFEKIKGDLLRFIKELG